MPSQQSSRTSTAALSQQPTLIGSGTSTPRAAGSALEQAINKYRNKLNGTELMQFQGTNIDYKRVANPSELRAPPTFCTS
jgi:hypothetical protein